MKKLLNKYMELQLEQRLHHRMLFFKADFQEKVLSAFVEKQNMRLKYLIAN